MTYDSEFIEGTTVKTQWVELLLCKQLKEQIKIVDVSPLGEDAVGYMSVIRRLHLEGSSHGPDTVVLKVDNF